MRMLTAMLSTFVAAAVASPAVAGAQTLDLLPTAQRSVSAPALSTARCDRPAGATSGVGRTTWTAAVGGYATVTLQAPTGSDWDLGLFDAGGNRLAGSLSFGPREIGHTWVRAGDTLTIQACRRSGDVQRADVWIARARTSTPAAGETRSSSASPTTTRRTSTGSPTSASTSRTTSATGARTSSCPATPSASC